ncbi:GerW family sporulation protein [Maribacter polysaccharolyticus]|uniref:GerW family sporulation protein n=1 Tax=Maribacter polysaccharolyticus TaxID=3020831 RepID=UPI00237F1474|nr:spore germination protein GerW family protein [Maribacter polysaccharolyticus]MDE3740452.1 spore germination protein GerW family protein [Maribacter polysaccharolyticus]
MELHLEELLGKITDFMKSEANTETVVGKQFDLGEFKCVPVIKVGMGFGSGGGEGTDSKIKKGQGMGAGAGVGIEPIGFLVTKGDRISFLEAGKSHGLAAVFEKIPELIEKISVNKKKEEASV